MSVRSRRRRAPRAPGRAMVAADAAQSRRGCRRADRNRASPPPRRSPVAISETATGRRARDRCRRRLRPTMRSAAGRCGDAAHVPDRRPLPRRHDAGDRRPWPPRSRRSNRHRQHQRHARPARQRRSRQSGNYVWSNNGQKFEVNYRGDIEFTADDTDVSADEPGRDSCASRTAAASAPTTPSSSRADSSGAHRAAVLGQRDASGRSIPKAGSGWRRCCRRFIRQSGIGAKARVARFMKSGGAPAVLAEISRIEGSWAKRVYFTELFKSAGTERRRRPAGARRRPAREVDSDFELASLLIASNRLITDDAARRAYLDAARTIGSDFELRRVLSSIVKAGPMTSRDRRRRARHQRSIDSDFERGVAARRVRRPSAARRNRRARPSSRRSPTVSSAFEHNRVLKARAAAHRSLRPRRVSPRWSRRPRSIRTSKRHRSCRSS